MGPLGIKKKFALHKTLITLYGPKMEWRGLNDKLNYQPVLLDEAMKSDFFLYKENKEIKKLFF